MVWTRARLKRQGAGWGTNAYHAQLSAPQSDNWRGSLVDGMRDASGQMYMRTATMTRRQGSSRRRIRLHFQTLTGYASVIATGRRILNVGRSSASFKSLPRPQIFRKERARNCSTLRMFTNAFKGT